MFGEFLVIHGLAISFLLSHKWDNYIALLKAQGYCEGGEGKMGKFVLREDLCETMSPELARIAAASHTCIIPAQDQVSLYSSKDEEGALPHP